MEMTVSPEEAQAAAQEQVSGMAASVAGADQAGSLDVSGAQAAAPDVSELLAAVHAQAAQLDALQKQIDARQAVADGEVKPPSLREAIAASSLPSQVSHLFSIVADYVEPESSDESSAESAA